MYVVVCIMTAALLYTKYHVHRLCWSMWDALTLEYPNTISISVSVYRVDDRRRKVEEVMQEANNLQVDEILYLSLIHISEPTRPY